MALPQSALSWFEIPVDNFERAKKFYSTIFQYQMEEMVIGGARLGILPYDQDNGGTGGAIAQGESFKPSANGTLVYLNGGEDLNIILNRVEAAGGSIEQAKTAVAPDMGFYAIFMDSEGNRVGLFSQH